MLRMTGWVVLVLAILWGALLPCHADLETRGGSVDRIERDIREIQRLIEANRRRQETFKTQVEQTTQQLQAATEAKEAARTEQAAARERLISALAKVAAVEDQYREMEKKLIAAMREEPAWKQIQAQQQLAKRDWETHHARVLQQLADNPPYNGLQALLQDARLRADPWRGTSDQATRKVALETVNSLETQIARLEMEALEADQEAMASQKKRDETQAMLEEADQAIREQVKQKPELLQAIRSVENAKTESAQAQKQVDEAKLKNVQAESAVSRTQARLQAAEAGVQQTDKEDRRLQSLLFAKERDLKIAMGNRKPKS